MKMLFFTVTNDLSYDQRMIRICSSLSAAGFGVRLIGRRLSNSRPLSDQPFLQTRLRCFFIRGPLFYAEYNIRLFFYLLFNKHDCVCAIDLDTILACYLSSRFKNTKRVYDAHELFCEMQEIVERPMIYKVWKRIEKMTVPRFSRGYTVNKPIADEFFRMYGVKYEVISNMAVLRPLQIPAKADKYILYQGAVNAGRSFDTLIPAMQFVDARLIVCGEGNYMGNAQRLVKELNLENKIIFTGNRSPDDLRSYTLNAWVGITLFEMKGKS
ncbi:MAG: glycosyltransferase, partial [Chitinophagaceae bacterium]